MPARMPARTFTRFVQFNGDSLHARMWQKTTESEKAAVVDPHHHHHSIFLFLPLVDHWEKKGLGACDEQRTWALRACCIGYRTLLLLLPVVRHAPLQCLCLRQIAFGARYPEDSFEIAARVSLGLRYASCTAVA